MRAQGETGGDSLGIQEAVSVHKAWLWKRIQEIVSVGPGGNGDQELAEQILILFEGATVVAIYRGAQAVITARDAAAALVERARA